MINDDDAISNNTKVDNDNHFEKSQDCFLTSFLSRRDHIINNINNETIMI